jgi:hypothetical protein
MRDVRITLLALGLISSFSTPASILDFTEVANGFQGSTSIELSNATITTFGEDTYVYHPGNFGALGSGGFCGIERGTCEAGAEVLFFDAISDLTFNAQYFNQGDSALLSIFNGDALLKSIVFGKRGQFYWYSMLHCNDIGTYLERLRALPLEFAIPFVERKTSLP